MAKREKGVGPYAGNDVKLRRDTTVDNSGNPTVKPRQISNIDEGSNGSDSGCTTVTDAKF